MTGAEALKRSLANARIQRIWSYPGAPLSRAQLALDEKPGHVQHRFAVNEHVAASLALGGALLASHNTCALLPHVGVSVALDTLATFGLQSELRSGALIIEGVDTEPKRSDIAVDHRGTLADVAQLAQLEASAPDEIYHLVRLGALASERTHMPVVVRLPERALEASGEVAEVPPELPRAHATFSRSAGPYVAVAPAWRYHVEKRTRRLGQLEPLADALALPQGSEGSLAVVMAGGLPARVAARALARKLPVLRLGMAWPLPRRLLLEFLRGRAQVLVLEEGEPFLERELALLLQREGVTCRVRGAGEARPVRADEERVEMLLGRFGGRARAEVEPERRGHQHWKVAHDALPPAADDGEPWPLHFARLREQLPSFADGDPRRALLQSLRALERPTVIAADPGNTGALGIRERLVDVKMNMGSAAPIAGALAAASEIEELPGAPLAVALIGDTNHYHSELLGLLDNAIARRDVLHVLVVNRKSEMTAGALTPYLADDALETQLRSAGLHVATASLGDPGLAQAVAYAASRSGPRALICYGESGSTDTDG